MWIDLICRLRQDCKFGVPAGEAEIAAAEKALGIDFPSELRALLAESNGVISGPHGAILVWPVERIEQDNLFFWTNSDFRDRYMPTDHLLFFGDSGVGDQFAFAVVNGRVQRSDVFEWDHETDSRTRVATSLAHFFEKWFAGTPWRGR